MQILRFIILIAGKIRKTKFVYAKKHLVLECSFLVVNFVFVLCSRWNKPSNRFRYQFEHSSFSSKTKSSNCTLILVNWIMDTNVDVDGSMILLTILSVFLIKVSMQFKLIVILVYE